ncbi:MAG TPA: aminotransferase class V-fold PLP-dependent enzyme [Candidatus Fimivicinus intestinavium]|nr:aminotransferase class V-fold PLP-dependent enzyme [Candidatus Fimivicinus intestinavium]
MIYLDNAATTYPKPRMVREAITHALAAFGANPGRSGHTMSLRTAERVYHCREQAAELFGLDEPENVIFTLNCTHAINMVLHGVLCRGDHVLTSDLEHNAVMRPLYRMAEEGTITYSSAHVCEGDFEQTVANFRAQIRPNTRILICTHASNVFGAVLPIAQLAALAHAHGALFVVDAAQSAGILPIDMKKTGIDFLCLPGHKGLYGPMGTGLLLCADGSAVRPLIEGGTGSLSAHLAQPPILPDKLESGTGNTPGILGLSAGFDFIRQAGQQNIREHELLLMQQLYDALSQIEKVLLYTHRPEDGKYVPLLSFNIFSLHSEEAAGRLNEDGIAVRAGLHCAPCAHKAYQTFETGTIRVAPSYFTSKKDLFQLIKSVQKIAKHPKT